MTLPRWHEEPIQKSHRRQEFDCGDEDMNQFIRRFARQGHERHIAKTFCAIDNSDPGRVLGFYTLTTASMGIKDIPPDLTKGLARHDVGGYKLARIATDLRVAGQGLGGQLLSAAALRCLRASHEVGGHLLYIDAKSGRAAQWYVNFGAAPLANHPLTLVIKLEDFVDGLRAKGLLGRIGGDQ
ncbi:MAG: GNAT family N-acetyltransferase [Thermomicrobiales bacterium]|nr:MAG: GNAT family N-acetyltransferase [Thermomicrobiales bacterium]